MGVGRLWGPSRRGPGHIGEGGMGCEGRGTWSAVALVIWKPRCPVLSAVAVRGVGRGTPLPLCIDGGRAAVPLGVMQQRMGSRRDLERGRWEG